MTTVKITFIEDGKVTDYTYKNVFCVSDNGYTVVIRFEDGEPKTASFYTKQVIELIVE